MRVHVFAFPPIEFTLKSYKHISQCKIILKYVQCQESICLLLALTAHLPSPRSHGTEQAKEFYFSMQIQQIERQDHVPCGRKKNLHSPQKALDSSNRA
jgi:hypothetical protein